MCCKVTNCNDYKACICLNEVTTGREDLSFWYLIRISPPYWLIFSSSNNTSSSTGLSIYCFCIKYGAEGENAARNTVLHHTFLGSHLWSLWGLVVKAILCERRASSSTIQWSWVNKKRILQLAKEVDWQRKHWMQRIFPTKSYHTENLYSTRTTT